MYFARFDLGLYSQLFVALTRHVNHVVQMDALRCCCVLSRLQWHANAVLGFHGLSMLALSLTSMWYKLLIFGLLQALRRSECHAVPWPGHARTCFWRNSCQWPLGTGIPGNSWEFVGIPTLIENVHESAFTWNILFRQPAAVNCDCTEIPCTTSVPMQYCGVPRFEKWVKSIGEMKYTFLDLLLMQTNTNSMLPSTETSTPNKISQSIGCPD